jgi:hypothetical protein
MANRPSSKTPPDVVLLVAYDAKDQVVLRKRLSLWKYYEEIHPLIETTNFELSEVSDA